MKNNRKNRKQKFIKIKNLLRTGKISFFVSQKVSNLHLQTIDKEDRFRLFLEKAKKKLYKNYKLSFRNPKVNYKIDYCDDDFIRDLKTELIEIRLT